MKMKGHFTELANGANLRDGANLTWKYIYIYIVYIYRFGVCMAYVKIPRNTHMLLQLETDLISSENSRNLAPKNELTSL